MFRTRQKIIIISLFDDQGVRYLPSRALPTVPSTTRFRNVSFMQIISSSALKINEWLRIITKPAVLFNRNQHSQSNSDNEFLPTMVGVPHSTCHLHCQSSAHAFTWPINYSTPPTHIDVPIIFSLFPQRIRLASTSLTSVTPLLPLVM